MRTSVSKYILENPAEAKRLETQATLSHYNVKEEFKELPPIRKGDRVLDAGCGTGLVARFLADAHPEALIHGCDFSEDRLIEARKLSNPAIHYFRSDLEHIDAASNHFDGITSRLVFEHLADPIAVASELYRITKPGGWACILDIDGLVFNMSPMSNELTRMIKDMQHLISVDLYVGRKLVPYLRRGGFQNVVATSEKIHLTGEQAKAERDLNLQRIKQSLPQVAEALGSYSAAEKFFSLYREESHRDDVVFEFQKVKALGFKEAK
jgi:ubiquinone/menaquinone biosynthesis C-methylase UbiE